MSRINNVGATLTKREAMALAMHLIDAVKDGADYLQLEVDTSRIREDEARLALVRVNGVHRVATSFEAWAYASAKTDETYAAAQAEAAAR